MYVSAVDHRRTAVALSTGVLSGGIQPIPKVPEPGENELARIQAAIDDRRVDAYVWPRRLDCRDALRGGHNAHEPHVTRTCLIEQVNRTHRAAARREHRVDDERRARRQVRRKLRVV